MKKRTEKQPVDNLFARKLATMSLPPSPNGFARLQARMGQSKPETRVVFWRNPAIQRSMAVAACLLLVCLFGWLYLSTETPISGNATVAVNKPDTSTERKSHEQIPLNPEADLATTGTNSDRKVPNLTGSEPANSSSVERGKLTVDNPTNDNRRLATVNSTTRKRKTTSQEEPAAMSTDQVAKTEVNTPSTKPMVEEQVAAATDKPAPVAERVLIVTIAEPKALLAARQAVKESTGEQAVASVADKPEKDSKAVNFWQQMKRIKQGEVFARKDAGEDEQGLLGRAYSGLKQTFDKDKSTKQ